MGHSLKAPTIIDNGGSRCGSDRRQLTINGYAPECRLGLERRCGVDRRKDIRPRKGNAIERRELFRGSINYFKTS
jgi:hypothetical protein